METTTESTPPRQRLQDMRLKASLGGGESRIASQHKRGKMTAMERIHFFLDKGSFVALDSYVVHDCQDFGMDQKKHLGDGVITGWGTVDGRLVYIFSQDFTVFGGSLSAMFARKVCKIMDLAIQNSAPLVGLNDSGGARIHEGVASLGGYADIFYRNVKASGVIPQLSLILGPCAGGAVYSPAMTDGIFMVDDTSHMFITGPDVIKTVTGEEVSFDDLGGAKTHTIQSGVVDRRFSNEIEVLQAGRKWLSYLPSSNQQKPPTATAPNLDDPRIKNAAEEIANLVPENPNIPYEMAEVVKCVVDPDSFWELKPEFALNILTGLARIGGKSVGIVGNNPHHMAGVLDIKASIKAAQFVRFCDCFNIPIITFVDVPGFLPGTDQERGGIIKHGAKLLYAYCEATVPKLTVITRKAYGGAYDVMSSKHIGGDLNLAWPSAEIAVMGAEGACNIIFRNEIKTASDPEQKRKELTATYREKFANPYVAAGKGYIDSVIFPEETRGYLLKGLEALKNKKVNTAPRKHGNIPL